nr:ribonuclease H-like domain-containing protein [Tanacetum cinerariifolium]
MNWKDTFLDLKAVRSLLIAEEMRLKSKVLASPMDYSSLMVFVAGSSNNSRPSFTAQGKPWKPCFNFAKGNYRYGDSCRYVHAHIPNASSGFNKGRGTSENSTNDLLNKLLAQLGNLGMNMSHTGTNTITPTISSSISLTQNYSVPIAYYTSPSPTAPAGPSAPHGFPMPAQLSLYYTAGPTHSVPAQSTSNSGQATVLPHAFTAGTLQDPSFGAWNMDTGASSHLNNYTTSLSTVLNSCMYLTVSVGDGHSIPVTNIGHSILPTPLKSLRLNNVLITPHIVKNLIFVRQFVRDNDCTIEFDSFGFSVKDFMTRRVLLRCDSTGDLYPVTAPSPIPHAFLVSQHTWNQHLGHPESDVLCRLVSNNVISCNKEKPPVLCHACQLGKHVRLSFVSSNTIVSSCFDIVHSDVWTSPISSLLESDVLCRLVSNNVISCNKEKPPVLCHACQLGKHVRLSFVSSNTIVSSCFDIVHSDVWTSPISSLLDEYNALIKNSTWTLVPRPPNVNVVRCMWLFHYKYLADGTLSRYKARLVANGSTQLEGVDVDETFSPVVKLGTIRTVVSLVASRHWSIHQLDRSLYGLKQAPRAWFQQFASYITRVRFHHIRFDSSLFIFHQGKDTAYLLLYVDDIVLTTSSSDLLHRSISSLHQEFALTDMGSLNYFLGISVTRDSSGMFLSQKKYAAEILERVVWFIAIPVELLLIESNLGTTSDVHVCLHMHDPREPYFSALKRILRYVRDTLDYGLQLFSSSTTDLVAYSDADWAGCHTTRQSNSGYCVFLGNNLLSWSAKRQPTLSRSSAEAEYRGVANVVAETCWLHNLLREVHTPLSPATLVYCDNVSDVYLSSNPVQHQRTKHIEIDIHFVRDLVATGHVLHVPSRYQFADIFTKGLPTVLFEEFHSSLSVRCPPAQTAEEC